MFNFRNKAKVSLMLGLMLAATGSIVSAGVAETPVVCEAGQVVAEDGTCGPDFDSWVQASDGSWMDPADLEAYEAQLLADADLPNPVTDPKAFCDALGLGMREDGTCFHPGYEFGGPHFEPAVPAAVEPAPVVEAPAVVVEPVEAAAVPVEAAVVAAAPAVDVPAATAPAVVETQVKVWPVGGADTGAKVDQ